MGSLFGEWVVSEVELDGFHVSVVVNPDRTFNFSDLLSVLSALHRRRRRDAAEADAAHPHRAPQGRAGPRGIHRPIPRKHPFASVIGPLTFALTEFRTAGARGAPYHFQAVTESGESLAWTGTLSADPLESRGKFAVENLILEKYTPYIEDKVRSDLTDGKLSVSGEYEVGYNDKKATMKLVGGEVHLRDLKISERANGQTAVALPAIDVTGIDADAIAFKATVGSVSLAGGHLVVRREKDGSINLLTMLQPVGPPAASVPAPAKLPDVVVKEIAVKGLNLDLTDLTTPQPAQLGPQRPAGLREKRHAGRGRGHAAVRRV